MLRTVCTLPWLIGVVGACGLALVGGAAGCKRSEASVATGRALFASVCARCHGADGTGGLPLWDGGPSPRNFHDAAFQASLTDAQLSQTIRAGKGSGMPAFSGTFDDAQIGALVAYVRSLDPGRGN